MAVLSFVLIFRVGFQIAFVFCGFLKLTFVSKVNMSHCALLSTGILFSGAASSGRTITSSSNQQTKKGGDKSAMKKEVRVVSFFF